MTLHVWVLGFSHFACCTEGFLKIPQGEALATFNLAISRLLSVLPALITGSQTDFLGFAQSNLRLVHIQQEVQYVGGREVGYALGPAVSLSSKAEEWELLTSLLPAPITRDQRGGLGRKAFGRAPTCAVWSRCFLAWLPPSSPAAFAENTVANLNDSSLELVTDL